MKKPLIVVGLGASAGGLEALREFFSAITLTNSRQLCFVVVQHMASQHKSMLANLLAKNTEMVVKDVSNGETPKAGTVYVNPPDFNLCLENNAFRLKAKTHHVGPTPSIDVFLNSLATYAAENSVAVILSGTGSDGSHGVRAIKASGGTVFVQSPDLAKYDGMPQSAINTGIVDFILPTKELAIEVTRLASDRAELNESLTGIGQDPFNQVLSLLQKRVGVDFTLYKPNTIERRMKRRMVTTRSSNLREYLKYIAKTPQEIGLLFQDILINVTAFYRDADQFEALRTHLRQALLKKCSGDYFRVWVAGCSTGEEVYTISIELNELIEELDIEADIQLFATDIDEHAMNIARSASYTEAAVESLGSNLKEKYFHQVEGTYTVKKFIREKVVFARHDLTRDPPFMKMDLISCRNLFIYFEPEVQQHILRVFHYALAPGGTLFLGRSESLGKNEDLFKPLDKQVKLYQRLDYEPDTTIRFSQLSFDRPIKKASTSSGGSSATEAVKTVVSKLAKNSILVDDNYSIQNIFGNARDYLEFPTGEMSYTVTKLLRREIRDVVNPLLYRAKRKRHQIKGRTFSIKTGRQNQVLQPIVTPLELDGGLSFIVEICDLTKDLGVTKSRKSDGSKLDVSIEELERELSDTREHLKTMIEQQEASNEELQALNEELNAANEEMQSTNEELETSNEELQSTNEELTTLNEELNVKSAELVSLNEYLESIQNAIDHPLFVVDKNLNLVRFNVAFPKSFNVSRGDIGKSIQMMNVGPVFKSAFDAVEKCVHEGVRQEVQIESSEHDYVVKVDPILNFKNEVDGAVVSIVENTALIRALHEVRQREEHLNSVLSNTPAIVSLKDSRGRYTFVNKRFYVGFGLEDESQVIGKTDEELLPPESAEPLRNQDFEVLHRRRAVEIEHTIMLNEKERKFLTSKVPLLDAQNTAHSICTISLDITERAEKERQLHVFRNVVASSNDGIMVFDVMGESYRASFVSSSVEKITGQRSSELLGHSILDMLNKLVEPGFMDLKLIKRQIREGRRASVEFRSRGAAGDYIWFEARFSHLRDRKGIITHTFMLLFDITQRKRDQQTIISQQEDLLKAGKLAALGEMAAGIAHELNTPLNAIQGYVDLLFQQADEGEIDFKSIIDVAENIERTVDTIAGVITGLRSVARLDEGPTNQICEVKQLTLDAMQLVEFHLRNKGVSVKTELPSQAVHIRCNPIQMTQVLINLINNSVDAIKNLQEKWIRIQALPDGDQIKIRVTDSGETMAPALAEKIMTPFFTTKKEGTGLGLSLSQSIVKNFGGNLRLDTDSKNTSFIINLPRENILEGEA